MVSDLRTTARRVLDDMKWFIADVDEEKKEMCPIVVLLHNIQKVCLKSSEIKALETNPAIESVVSRFAACGEGNACVVVGKSDSGRTTVVKNAVEEFELSAKLKVVSVAQLGSEKNTLQMLTDDNDIKSCVLLIEDADELASRQRQSLLYLLLDTTRKGSDRQWLVFLMVQHQNFITSLEKRVRSRLPMARIVFQPASTLNDYVKAFGSFLGSEHSDCSSVWMKFLKDFLADSSVLAELNYLFSADNSYAVLKRVTSTFLCLYLSNESNRPASELFSDAVEMVLPRKHSLEPIIRSLPLWSLCVLLCVYRRLRSSPVSAAVGYRKIAQDFRRVGNTVDSRARVPSDLAVYRELDRLVDYGILVADTKANNIVFRRCSLNVHSKTLGEVLRGITLPVAIGYWFDSQSAQ